MTSIPRFGIAFAGLSAVALFAQTTDFSFERTQTFLRTYCKGCHQGASPAGGFHVDEVRTAASLQGAAQRWIRINARLSNGSMPPKGVPHPGLDEREQFTKWVESALHEQACAAGITPGPSGIRRLNRDEYTATVQDLLDIHVDVGQALPSEGAGGEGFDNAAETLFLSPLHSEKYMDAAKFALDFAAKEYKSRARILVSKPGPDISPSQAAHEILKAFLPRAFRRPVTETDIAPYMRLFEAARKQGDPFEPSIFFALRGVLMSPLFLFREEPPNDSATAQPVDQFALASRLSYFLWGSMPDELLFDLAAEGKLQNPAVLKALIPRMLHQDRSLNLAQRFVEQWLRTRELTGDKAPDAKLFPAYARDQELRDDIRLQPVLFFRELLLRNLSLLNLIDSNHTIATKNLAKYLTLDLPINKATSQQPQWVALPEGSHRGGLLGMPAVLAVSSYPYRTSPVLRGAWILDSMLGTPPPPPPPNVPALEEAHEGAPASMRERLLQHRANAACAGCHNRIDPLGFALENYDPIGRWRDQDAGKAIDNSGEMPDGKTFHGPDELKAILLERKELFVRNLTHKMLGYALGRGLTLTDSCAVDDIVAQLRQNDYSAQTLIEAIVLSVPFRYQSGRVLVSVRYKEQQKR